MDRQEISRYKELFKYLHFFEEHYLKKKYDKQITGDLFVNLFAKASVPPVQYLPLSVSDICYKRNLLKIIFLEKILSQNIGYELFRHFVLNSSYRDTLINIVEKHIKVKNEIREKLNFNKYLKNIIFYRLSKQWLSRHHPNANFKISQILINTCLLDDIQIENNQIHYYFKVDHSALQKARMEEIYATFGWLNQNKIYCLEMYNDIKVKDNYLIISYFSDEIKRYFSLNTVNSHTIPSQFNFYSKFMMYRFNDKYCYKYFDEKSIRGAIIRSFSYFMEDGNTKETIFKSSFFSLGLPENENIRNYLSEINSIKNFYLID